MYDPQTKLSYVEYELGRILDRWAVNGRKPPVSLAALYGFLVSDRHAPSLLAVLSGAVDAYLVDINEAARRLSVSKSTVERLVRRGELRAVKLGGAVRIRTGDLERYVEGLPENGVSSNDDSQLPVAATGPATDPKATPKPDTQASGVNGLATGLPPMVATGVRHRD